MTSQVAATLRAVMAIDPERAAIDFEACDHTWGELAGAAGEIERALDAMGLAGPARVGVMLRNRPGHVAAIAATLASGRCLVSLNPGLPHERLCSDIDQLALPAVIAQTEDIERPGVADALARSGAGAVAIGARLEGAHPAHGLERPRHTRAGAPDVAIEMLTSGTTGTPKRVQLSHEAFAASFAAFTRYERGRAGAEQPQLRSGVVMVTNPLTHIGGIYGLIGALLSGRKIALLEKFTVAGWVDAVRRNRPKVAGAVPSALRMLLDANVDREALASLTALISGTAPLSPDLVDAIMEKYAIPVLANYGATEFAGAVAGWTLDDFRALWPIKRGAAGRLHANVAARVVDPENGATLNPGEEGLLELKGDQLGPAHRLNGGAWLRTTDRVVIDADSFLFVKGRADNAIIRGGFKIHPDDIVAAIHQHPSVREAAVIAIPDDRLGAAPAAAVILKDGIGAPDPDEFKEFLRRRLIAYQVPVRILFVADFPRTPSMKPSAAGLRALFEEPVL